MLRKKKKRKQVQEEDVKERLPEHGLLEKQSEKAWKLFYLRKRKCKGGEKFSVFL